MSIEPIKCWLVASSYYKKENGIELVSKRTQHDLVVMKTLYCLFLGENENYNVFPQMKVNSSSFNEKLSMQL